MNRTGHLYSSRTPRDAFNGRDQECNVLILRSVTRSSDKIDYGMPEYYEVLLVLPSGGIRYLSSYRLLPNATWIA